MICYKDYLNQEIINNDNEVGTVLSFDQDRIVIKYPNTEKTYSSEIAIKSGFITFRNTQLEKLIESEFHELEENKTKKQEEAAKESEKHLAYVREINKTYWKLLRKNEVLCGWFGKDFKYPPLVEFEKKHQQILNKRMKKLSSYIWEHDYTDDYISNPFWL